MLSIIDTTKSYNGNTVVNVPQLEIATGEIIGLVGNNGAGKTTLARQYAHARKSSVVWEINSETKENLRNSFENLAYALAKTEEEKKTLRERQEIKDAKERGGKIHQFVMERLRVQSNWLLIFDNVEKFSEIKEYFPQDSLIWGNGRVIITTRDANIQIKQKNVIYVEELSDDKKLEFFSRTFYNKLSGSPDKTIIKYCDSLVMLQIPLLAQVSRPVPCDYFFCRCECG